MNARPRIIIAVDWGGSKNESHFPKISDQHTCNVKINVQTEI